MTEQLIKDLKEIQNSFACIYIRRCVRVKREK